MRGTVCALAAVLLLSGCAGNDPPASPAAADPSAASPTDSAETGGVAETIPAEPPTEVEDTGPKALYFEETFALTITHVHVPASGTSPNVQQTRINQDPNCVGFGKDQIWLILNGTAEATWSNPSPFAQKMTLDVRDIGLMASNNGSASPAILDFGRFQTVPNALLGLWFIVQPTDPGVVVQQPVELKIAFHYLGIPDPNTVVEPCVYAAAFEDEAAAASEVRP